jgi:hypothetical protein
VTVKRRGTAIVLVTAVVAGGVAFARSDASRSTPTEPLKVVEVPTPRFPVPGFDTIGTFPQVRGASIDLHAVNKALRAAVLADQGAYAPYARKEKPQVTYPKDNGVYRTRVDRDLLSASTVVVSALMPVTEELFPDQHDGDGWLGITIRVPSGTRVAITDLFADPGKGCVPWQRRGRIVSDEPRAPPACGSTPATTARRPGTIAPSR